ncbi:MAG: Bug family tripartite tricarboxylate transporter substrate binding protein [Aquabacterium sp.]
MKHDPAPTRRRALQLLATAAALPKVAWAQPAARSWPVDTLRFMAPVPAGGGVDLLCRQLAERLAPLLGANVVVENKPGAGGLLGARALAGSAADGSSIGYLHAGHLTVQAMGGKLDLASEFMPVVGRYSASQFVIAVATEAPQQTLADLVKAALAKPGQLSYGSGGQGTPAHLVVEKLRMAVPGLDLVHVPFKGAVEAVNTLLGRNLDFVAGLMSAVLPHVKSGRVRALAVTGEQRSALLPAVPTLIESGYAGLSHTSWGGVFGPARLPPALVATLRGALQRVAAQPDFQTFVNSTGSELIATESAAEFNAYLKAALVSEAALVSRLGMKLQ